jgi:O-methyltransferase
MSRSPIDAPVFAPSRLTHGRRSALNALLTDLKLRPVPGATAELGVWCGAASRHIALRFPDRTHYAIDTFEGIPNGCAQYNDEHQFGLHKEMYPGTMDRLNLPNIKVLKGYFPREVCPPDEERFAFVHLDADSGESTRDGLAYFLPRMNKGGFLLLDDYGFHKTPGVKMACDAFGLKPEMCELYQGLVICD